MRVRLYRAVSIPQPDCGGLVDRPLDRAVATVADDPVVVALTAFITDGLNSGRDFLALGTGAEGGDFFFHDGDNSHPERNRQREPIPEDQCCNHS